MYEACLPQSVIFLTFQIILIYGNYMNSSRRGVAYGFKLESLYKVRLCLHSHAKDD